MASWALRGAKEGRSTWWVQGYLAGKGANPSGRLTTPRGAVRCCGQAHAAACSPQHVGQPCEFFSAAHDGCSHCVRFYVEVDLLNPATQSLNKKFNALSWARA
ncbi:MAG: hypothetical protein ACK559_29225, partial [bacterium]